MTGGSSGGPVFAQLANGQWGIFGVVNRGESTGETANDIGVRQFTAYFDNRFVPFYNAVVQQVAAQGW